MREHPQILIVDDDERLRGRLAVYLESQGLGVRIAGDGREMRDAVANFVPDLVIMDLVMPGEDGLSLTRYLREHHDLGIIILTGKGEPVDRIVGLEIGADDYVAKPFELRELLARVRSVLRRTGPREDGPREDGPREGGPADSPTNGRLVYFSGWSLDLPARRLTAPGGEEMRLTNAEFNILEAFVNNPNRVLDRDRLMDAAGGRDWQPLDRSIDLHISNLRRKIEDDPKNPHLIQTMRGAGYMFTADVSRGKE